MRTVIFQTKRQDRVKINKNVKTQKSTKESKIHKSSKRNSLNVIQKQRNHLKFLDRIISASLKPMTLVFNETKLLDNLKKQKRWQNLIFC